LAASFKGKGSVIRFGRRALATRPVNPALTVAAAVGGHIVHGGGTFLHLEVPPHAAPADWDPKSSPEWDLEEIWSLDDWPDVEVAKERLAESASAQ